MAPETPRKNGAAADSDKGNADKKLIITLCNLIAGSESVKMDNSKIAPILGITHASNVPRAVNRMVGPYGFQYKGGRIIKEGDSNPGAAASAEGDGKGIDAGNGNGNGVDNGNGGENGAVDPSRIEKPQPATETRKGRGRPRKHPVPVSKKRKLDVTEEEQVGDDGAVFEDGEA